MRTNQRPRRYLTRHWLTLLTPAFRYSSSRGAYVLRGVGNRVGPVLRVDRRLVLRQIDGADRRRRAHTA